MEPEARPLAEPPARILIIDDTLANRLLLSSQLEAEGYLVSQASDGRSGLESARLQHPDLILLDVMMPELTGYEVCAALKQDAATAAIPIVMLTTLQEVEYRIEGLKAGADELLARPHHRQELAVRVRALIQLKRAREKLQEERDRLQLLTIEIGEERRKLAAILAHSSDGIITTDENRHIVLLNQAAERLFGLPADHATGQPLQQILALAKLVPLFAPAAALPATQEIVLDDRKILYGTVSSIQGVGYLAVLRDVTELKRIEALRLAQERREKQLVKETFTRYMAPDLVDQVFANGAGILGRHERRHAVVLFADLRGFTGLLVRVEADAAILLLNEFFMHMTDIVNRFKGTVFDMAGDELMVGFNVPFDQPDASHRALLAAVAMQRRFSKLLRLWQGQSGAELGLGVGIDQGEVVVGNVGAETRMNFAMVGEAVNTAHRLVDMAQHGQVIISDSVYQAVGHNRPRLLELAAFEAVGPVALKGKIRSQLLHRATIGRGQKNRASSC